MKPGEIRGAINVAKAQNGKRKAADEGLDVRRRSVVNIKTIFSGLN